MVMHARKIPRVSDGYFEKHHTNSYQDNSKYDAKGICTEQNNSERNSPNGNIVLSDSSDGPDDLSRDYTYPNKAYYTQKLQEKEKEPRNEKDKFVNNSKDKPTEHAISPIDKKNVTKDPRENIFRTNHDRNMTEDLPLSNNHKVAVPVHCRELNQKKNPLGVFCQENDKKEPKERVNRVGDWTEHKSSSGKLYYFNAKAELSQWEKPKEWLEKEGVSALLRPQHHPYKQPFDKHSIKRLNNVNISSNILKEPVPQSVPYPYSQLKQKYPTWNKMNNCTDSRINNPENCIAIPNEMQSQDMEICSGSSTPTSENLSTHEQISFTGESITLSGPGTPIVKSEVKMEPSTSSHSVLSSCGKSTVITPTSQNASPIIDRLYNSMCPTSKLETDISFDRKSPPTPTHSENHDIDESKKSSPRSDTGPIVDIPKPVCSIISPSYANNVKHELTQHVLDWPAVAVEKQIAKLAEDMRSTVHIHIPKVELELSLLRSKARSAETHVVRLEHKFLHLEDLKRIEPPRKYSMYNGDEEGEKSKSNENPTTTDDNKNNTRENCNEDENSLIASQATTIADDEDMKKRNNDSIFTPDTDHR